MPLEDATNVHFVAAKRKRQNEKLQKNMPQFPLSITFSAAEMCAKFKGRGRHQGNYYSTPSITLYWRRQRSQLIFHYNESVSNEIDFLYSLRARQSAVYVTGQALAGSNFSQAVAPPGAAMP